VNLRTRIGLAGGAVVFGALTVVSAVLYPTEVGQVRRQTETALVNGAAAAPQTLSQIKEQLSATGGKPFPTEPLDLGPLLLQIVPDLTASPGDSLAPIEDRDRLVAKGVDPPYFQTVTYRGEPYRVYTAVMEPGAGLLIRVARPLSDERATLTRLWLLLVGLTVAASLGAAGAARLAAGRVLQPVRRLTEAVERVAATRDLTAPVPGGGADEIGRLARSFATMMAALDESVQAQRRLVADASHELRTPLTSLTTNLELLDERGGTADPQAPALVHAARGQTRELTVLVNDLVDLARYGEGEIHTEDSRLDLLAERVVDRAAARTPAVRFETSLAQSPVHADPDAVERAIGNLVDNAIKWSPPGGRVQVVVAAGEVTVSDEGPGIPAADLPYVFDRFYRSPTARALPGSGLGLAIVRQIAETHGGRVAAEPLARGVCLRLSFPAAP
jgi:two-component system sensor histidine kinase MprB